MTKVIASYDSTFNYYYIDWIKPGDAVLGNYDVKVETRITSNLACERCARAHEKKTKPRRLIP